MLTQICILFSDVAGHSGQSFRRNLAGLLITALAVMQLWTDEEPSLLAGRIISRLKGTARADEHEEVRATAVRVLGGLHRSDLADFLRETAARDVSQLVRYEASVALLDLERSGGRR